jgi:hypothetical protein
VQQWNHYERFLGLRDKDKVLALPANPDPVTLRKHAQLSDVACLVPKDIVDKYRFRGEYAEDLDLGVRLVRDGHRLGLLRSTCVIHSHNRPAYYHLKRGYMDKLGVARILDEPVGRPAGGPEDVLSDIIAAYAAMRELTVRGLMGGRDLVPFGEFGSTVTDMFARLTASPLNGREIAKSEFVDPRFHHFVSAIRRSAQPQAGSKRPSGEILAGVREFLALTLGYMDGVYEKVDPTIVNDFLLSVYKHLANLAGASLAKSLPDPAGEGGSIGSKLRAELEDRTIRWEENAPVIS